MSASTLAYCWKIVREDGFEIRATEHDVPITFLSEVYDPSKSLNTTKIQKSVGPSADDLEVTGAIDSESITVEDIELGKYDGASVDIYIVDWKNPATYSHKFSGKFGDVSASEYGFQTVLRSNSYDFGITQGRVFTRRCNARLGDSRCQKVLDSSAFEKDTTVVLATELVVNVTDLSEYVDGWFSLGKLIKADGTEIPIKTHSGNVLVLWEQPRVALNPSDPVTIQAGCDKASTTCQTKFDNLDNFRGFPLIPGNDFLATYPVQGEDTYDGGSIITHQS